MRRANDLEIRVAVGTPSGPNSHIFRVWSRRGESNIYAAIRESAASVKISLHDGGECHAGLTSELARKNPELVTQLGGSRHQSKWFRRTHVGSQQEVPLVFAVPVAGLSHWRRQPPSAPSLVWLSPPPTGVIAISCVFTGSHLGENEWPGRDRGDTLLGMKRLPNGETFWLLWFASTAHSRVTSVLEYAQEKMSSTTPVQLAPPEEGVYRHHRLVALAPNTELRALLVVDGDPRAAP